jgi:hypothetical protein
MHTTPNGLYYNWLDEAGQKIAHISLHNSRKQHPDPAHDSRTRIGGFHIKLDGSEKSRRVMLNYNRQGDGSFEVTVCQTVQRNATGVIQNVDDDHLLNELVQQFVGALINYLRDVVGARAFVTYGCSDD